MMYFQEEIAKARDCLRRAQQDLSEELRSYPGPVAGCDEQYTFLISERRKVSDAISALNADIFIATPRQLTPGAEIEQR